MEANAIIELLVAALQSVHVGTAGARASEIDALEWRRLREGHWQRLAESTELYRVARHEAGHATVAIKLDHPVDCIVMQRDGSAETRLSPHYDPPEVTAMFHLAGPCTDLYGGAERTLQELAQCHDVLKARMALDQTECTAHEIATRTVTMVEASWGAINQVARALRARGELGGLEVIGVMYAGRPQ